ncbi:hypothetical protein D3C75_857230 [compost metagenome]
MIGNPCFRRIGGDKLQLIIFGQGQISLIVAVGIDHPADTGNDLMRINRLLLHDTVQQHRVEIILLGHQPTESLPDRHDDGRTSTKQTLFVHLLQLPVYEGTHEIPFPKLNHPFRILRQAGLSGSG